MNMLDKGTQLETNSIIRYPKQPVVKAVSINASLTKPDEALQATRSATGISHEAATIPLEAPGEKTFSFSPTIENELSPVPSGVTTPAQKAMVQESSSEATTLAATGESMSKVAAPVDDAEASSIAPTVAKKLAANTQDLPQKRPSRLSNKAKFNTTMSPKPSLFHETHS